MNNPYDKGMQRTVDSAAKRKWQHAGSLARASRHQGWCCFTILPCFSMQRAMVPEGFVVVCGVACLMPTLATQLEFVRWSDSVASKSDSTDTKSTMDPCSQRVAAQRPGCMDAWAGSII